MPLEFALYVLPNAKTLRFIESGSLLALLHKWTMRTCFNAQEEIYLATMDEIEQVRSAHPRIGRHIGPPCVIRNGLISPRCTEGTHFCGVPVWRDFPNAVRASDAGSEDAGPRPSTASCISAWLVHLYTASGIVLAFLAARAIIDFDYRTAFFWLWLQVVVDATDGVLARRVRVPRAHSLVRRRQARRHHRLPDVRVRAGAVRLARRARAECVGAAGGRAMLLSSAYGFNRTDAKTADHFFTGFPSYWNIVTFYLLIARWPPTVNAAILLVLAVLVFVPIRYVYPSRTPQWRVHDERRRARSGAR